MSETLNPAGASLPVVDGQPAPADAVGMQLRAAREAQGLSIDEVAHAIKFSQRQIELLEADDYAALPGNAIVRGFVRSYARQLKLDGGALLSQLEHALPAAPIEVRPPDNMGNATQPGVLRTMSPLVAGVVVLLLAAVMLALWHFLAPSAGRSVVATPTGSAAVSSSATGTSPSSAAASEPVAPVVNPATSLRFAFADRAWLEVTDGSRQVLHSGESPGGSQLTLNGRPPFDIVIGNANKVTLSYGDKVIDLVPYMRADVARFTLE